jgi:hypothetical protein
MANDTNPISFTSRSYATIKNDIDSDPELVEKPNWFKRLIAGIGDVISIWLNAIANLMYLRTAFTRNAVQDLCELIDYDLSPQTTSSGIVLFYINTALGTGIFPFSVALADLKAKSQGSLLVSSLPFESRAAATFSLETDTFTRNGNSLIMAAVSPGYSGHKIRFSSSVTLPLPLVANKDYYSIYDGSLKLSTWSRSTTTATITFNAHGLTNGDKINITSSSDTSAIPNATYTITYIGVNSFSITCFNAGGTSGTLYYDESFMIQVAGSLADAYAGNVISLTSAGSGTHSVVYYSKAVSVYQQETISTPVSLGQSDGITQWQEYDLPDRMILPDTLSVSINSIAWTKVTGWIDYTATDKVFKWLPKSNQQSFIRFADGIWGMIPGQYQIMATYSKGGGINSRVQNPNRVTTYTGSDSHITGVSNPLAITGGADEETLINAKRVAPILLKSRDRFVTSEDGIAIVQAYGGITQVAINKNVYGILSCQVVGIASGGGNPSSALRSTIQTLLISKTILDSIDVRFDTATLTSIAVTAAGHPKSGYDWTLNVLPYFRLAYQLLTSETGLEILTTYQENGVDTARVLINTLFQSSFTSSDNTQIVQYLEKFEPRSFGETIQESDITSFVDAYTIGLDYSTLTTFGTGFPLTLAAAAITTTGVLTLSQI